MSPRILAISALMNLVTFGCDLGSQPDNQPTVTVADGIRYALSLEQIVFRVADSVHGELLVTNVTSRQIQLVFPNQHALRWRLLDHLDRELLTYPTGWFPAFSFLTIEPGEAKSYAFSFVLKDRHNIAFRAGDYIFEARLDRADSPYLQKDIYVR
jgi:hypothetical protein